MKRDNIVDDTMSEETVPASAAAAENPVRKRDLPPCEQRSFAY